jgi:hypothetical protein
MDAEMVISNDGSHAPARSYLKQILEELVVDGYLDGNSRHVIALRGITNGAPTSTERQRAVHAATGSLDAVCRSLADEFEDDVLMGVGAG